MSYDFLASAAGNDTKMMSFERKRGKIREREREREREERERGRDEMQHHFDFSFCFVGDAIANCTDLLYFTQ